MKIDRMCMINNMKTRKDMMIKKKMRTNLVNKMKKGIGVRGSKESESHLCEMRSLKGSIRKEEKASIRKRKRQKVVSFSS